MAKRSIDVDAEISTAKRARVDQGEPDPRPDELQQIDRTTVETAAIGLVDAQNALLVAKKAKKRAQAAFEAALIADMDKSASFLLWPWIRSASGAHGRTGRHYALSHDRDPAGDDSLPQAAALVLG